MPKEQHLKNALKYSLYREDQPDKTTNDYENYHLSTLELLLQDVAQGVYSLEDFQQYWAAVQSDVAQFLNQQKS